MSGEDGLEKGLERRWRGGRREGKETRRTVRDNESDGELMENDDDGSGRRAASDIRECMSNHRTRFSISMSNEHQHQQHWRAIGR